MIVNSIQPRYSSYNPVFGDFKRVLFKIETGGRTVKNIERTCNTWAMRGFPTVDERADYIIKNGLRHIYDFGCSNAIDAICLLIALNEKGGSEQLKKCTPIIVGDVDGGAKYYFDNNKFFLQPEETFRIDDYTNGKFLKYFSSDYTPDMLRAGYWHFSPYYKSMIDYSLGNVLEDYKVIEPEKSFVQPKNFWPYLNIQNREDIAKKLVQHIGKSSCICLGEVDNHALDGGSTAKELLIKNGATLADGQEYIYRKF